MIGSVVGVGIAALALLMLCRRRRQYQGIQAIANSESVFDSNIKPYDQSPYESKLRAYGQNPDFGGGDATLSTAQTATFVPSTPSAAGHPRSEDGTQLMFGTSLFSPLERAGAEGQLGSWPQEGDARQPANGGRSLPSPPISGAFPRDRKLPPQAAPTSEGQVDDARSDSRSIAPSESVQSAAMDRMVDVLAERIAARFGADADTMHTMHPPPGYE